MRISDSLILPLVDPPTQEDLISINDSAIKSGFCGVSFPAGWNVLVWDLHNRLLASDPDYKVIQIKEKFGGLRCYYQLSDRLNNQCKQNLSILVQLYEALSAITCQECGDKGKIRTKLSWRKCLCKSCYKVERKKNPPQQRPPWKQHPWKI